MKLKRLITLFTAVTMLLSAAEAYGAYASEPREEVTLIVEVTGDAALETKTAVFMGASEYNKTDASSGHTARIMLVQESVKSDITSKVDRKADIGFTYTNVLNGFSVTADKSDIERIKALPNVEKVYVAGKHRYIKPIENDEISLASDDDTTASMSDSCCQMINVPYMHEMGYKGQGQAIAVIDSELDVNHEFFSSPIESPKYSKSDIARLISEKNLNVKISANQVWRSNKIPFAYSYAQNNADVYSTFLVHGSHVCGIAAGKNGTHRDGTKFSGVAPEAQIIFMGVMEDGDENLPDDAIIAAIDDASKMDIAAINMSLGADFTLFGGGLGDLFTKVINNAVNAGIEVCAASGNAGSGGLYVRDVDYSTSGLPAVVSASTSVAAAYGDTGEICYFSSWGTNTTLELKPEITTPGGYIYSSVPDDKYAIFSGTSMATPHMTGAAALMRQYIEANYQGKYDNPARFIENLAMTGAKVILEDETEKIPYSPRNQGAGLIDLKTAATTPVILLGDSGKPKISLKDKLTDIFEIEFTAKNFTDTNVTYDTIKPSVFTDVEYFNENLGNYFFNDELKKLNFTVFDMPESVTIPANGETKIKLTIQLDSNETAENLKIFTNGFYLDGFVELSDSGDTVPTISIPYTGFYGDWTAAPTFEKPYYQNDEETWYDTCLRSGADKCICSEATGERCKILGRNQLLEPFKGRMTDEYENESYAGISPNGDGMFDFLCVTVEPDRAMENCSVRIENANGEIMDVDAEASENDGFTVLQEGSGASNSDKADSAPLDKYDKYLINCTEFNDLSSLSDGDYTVYVTGRLAYEGSREEEISMKFYVDTVAPQITKKEVCEADGRTYLDLSISDNRYVMGAAVEGKNINGTNFTKSAYTKAGKTGDVSIDITGADISTLKITVLDYAYNKYECRAAGEITAAMQQQPVFKENSTDISFVISNETFKTVTADIIAAVYDENGVLTAVSVKRGETIPQDISSDTFTFEGNLSGKNIKLMIFDALENMKPLGRGEHFDIKEQGQNDVPAFSYPFAFARRSSSSGLVKVYALLQN